MDAEKFKKTILEKSGKDYGICPPPLDAQEALNILTEHFLGEDWYVTIPVNQQQVNTEAVYEILRKFPEKKTEKGILCGLGLHRYKTIAINHIYHRKCKCGKELYNN